MPEKKPDVDEEDPDKNGKCEIRADLVPDTPEYDLDLDGQHKKDKQKNEPLVIVPEFFVILFVRVDAGENGEQGDKTRHDKGDEKESPELRHVSVSLAGSVPVRYDAIRSCWIDGDGKGEGKNEAGNNCKPDEFHISLLGIDPVRR